MFGGGESSAPQTCVEMGLYVLNRLALVE